MSMRKIGQFIGNDNRIVAIFWDSDVQEYQVKMKECGKKAWHEDATYFTDDKADALATANTMIEG